MPTYALRLETPDQSAVYCKCSVVDCAPCQSMLVVRDASWLWKEAAPLIQNFADRLGLKLVFEFEGELK